MIDYKEILRWIFLSIVILTVWQFCEDISHLIYSCSYSGMQLDQHHQIISELQTRVESLERKVDYLESQFPYVGK